MLIVLEGADRTGKSTLASTLAEMTTKFGRRPKVIHSGVPEPGSHPLRDYALPLCAYEPVPDSRRKDMRSLIFDRLHLGDWIYGPLYRGGCRQTPAQRAFIDSLIEARGGIRVHVTADPVTIRHRCAIAGEDYLKDNDVETVIRGFNHECFEDWLTIDSSGWNGPEDVRNVARQLLIAALAAERRHVGIYAAAPDYVGPRRPRILLVMDDKVDGVDRVQPSYGTATPWEGSPGEYLFGSLTDMNIPVSAYIGIVNAGAPSLKGLYVALKQPTVIALRPGPLPEIEQHVAHRLRAPDTQARLSPDNPKKASIRRAAYGTQLRAILANNLRPTDLTG